MNRLFVWERVNKSRTDSLLTGYFLPRIPNITTKDSQIPPPAKPILDPQQGYWTERGRQRNEIAGNKAIACVAGRILVLGEFFWLVYPYPASYAGYKGTVDATFCGKLTWCARDILWESYMTHYPPKYPTWRRLWKFNLPHQKMYPILFWQVLVPVEAYLWLFILSSSWIFLNIILG